MVTLLWQTALLLLGAYFLGAFLGCMFRKVLSPAQRPGVATAVGAGTAAAAATVVANGTDRFEKALTGESLAAERVEVERAEHAAQASGAIERVEPKIETIAASLPERDLNDVQSVAVEPVPVSGEVQPDVTRDVAARNADAWSPASPSPGTAVAAGAATATAAAIGAAAFSRPAPAPTPRPNDLQDIRGIDTALAERLNASGVTRWDQIAAWSAADVDRFGRDLEVGKRIERENWVEQASILAVGGSTAYAARRALGEADVTAAPAVGGWAPRIDPAASESATAETVATHSEPAPVVSDDSSATDNSGTAAAVAATAAVAAATVANQMPVDDQVDAAETASVEVSRSNVTSGEAVADDGFGLDAYPRAAGTDGSAVVAADIQRSDSTTAAPESIEAVSPVASPISTDETDAPRWRWDANDVPAGRDLTTGTEAGAAASDDDTTGLGAAAAVAAVGAAAAAAISQTDTADGSYAAEPVAPVAANEEPISGDIDSEPLTGLRSVRSAALVGDRAMPLEADDLKRIRGLGIRDETQLKALGVTTYAQISALTADDIARVDSETGLAGRIGRENWIEQAKILEGSRTTAYAERIDAGLEGAATAVAATPIDPASLRADEVEKAEVAATDGAEAPSTEIHDEPLHGVADQAVIDESASGFADQISEIAPLELEDDGIAPVDSSNDSAASIAVAGAAAGVASVTSGMGTNDGDDSIEAATGSDASTASVNEAIGAPSDDLKRIRGVGVLIEKKLNALGYVRYDQIANWTQSDIDRVNGELAFQHRIEREKWIEQARILASGGETEFSQRVDRNEV